MSQHLPVGPMRDLLALLKGGQEHGWVDAHFVKDRTGWPYRVTLERLALAVDAGYAETQTTMGVRRYRGTEKGAELL